MVLETEDTHGGEDSPRYQVNELYLPNPKEQKQKRKIHAYAHCILRTLYIIF